MWSTPACSSKTCVRSSSVNGCMSTRSRWTCGAVDRACRGLRLQGQKHSASTHASVEVLASVGVQELVARSG